VLIVSSHDRDSAMTDRLFSKKCGNPRCRQSAVALATVPYSVSIDHDGRKYNVNMAALTAPRCAVCGTLVLDDEANRQISDAFRHAAGLLGPEQIRDSRLALGLKQQELADSLGVAVSTLSRWETGAQIQQRSLDRFLRLFFAMREVRQALAAPNLKSNLDPQPVSSPS
jgi:putative zinc finger/helix-turn-helix YgiT family protein